MLLALVPLLTSLLAGAAPAAALAGLGLSGWAAIADAALTSLPSEVNALSALHPLLAKVFAAVEEGSSVPHVAQMAHSAAQENYEASLREQPGAGSATSSEDY